MKMRNVFKANLNKLSRSSFKQSQWKVRIPLLRDSLVSTGLVLAFGCLVALAQGSNTPKNPWKSRKVFQAKDCVKCHAVYGEGGKIGPDLGQRKFYGSYLQLAGVLRNHFPRMYEAMQKERVPWFELSDQEMSDLIAYVFYIRYIGEPGNEYRGRKLIETKGCIKCHKFGGVGGDLGPDICSSKEYMSPLQLAEGLWNHGPQLTQLFEEKKLKRPEFAGNEMIDLAVAIRSYMSPTKVPVEAFSLGDAARGEKLIGNKGCKNCHSIRGVGGNIGPDFVNLDLNCSVTEIAGRMWNHGPKMWAAMQEKGMAVPTFEKGELADVIAYIYGLKLENVGGDASKGRQVADNKQCLTCHSLQATPVGEKGTDIAPNLATGAGRRTPLEMVTTMWNHAPRMREKIGEKKLQWPKFVDDEMADLYAYLHSMRR
jgi:cytochrome c551/c552